MEQICKGMYLIETVTLICCPGKPTAMVSSCCDMMQKPVYCIAASSGIGRKERAFSSFYSMN